MILRSGYFNDMIKSRRRLNDIRLNGKHVFMLSFCFSPSSLSLSSSVFGSWCEIIRFTLQK